MEGLNAAITELLGAKVTDSHPLHGGSLSEVRQVTLSDGRAIVAKSGPLVAREAQMLAAIRETGTPAPEILGVRGQILLLEALNETSATPTAWRALAEGLKDLHIPHGSTYGWPQDYAFAQLPISNQQTSHWPTFWAERRLLSMQKTLHPDLARRLKTLATRLPDTLPATPPPCLLHGDLWSGNVLFSNNKAYLIDPASYYGDPEVDLAMLHLFGAPHPAFTEAYGPLAPGWQTRRAIYQLWPALVHLHLFGAGYRGMVEGLLGTLNA